MSPSTHSAPLQQQKHQNKAQATSAASQPPAAQQSCPGRRDHPTSPQTCSVATSSPTDSSDTHEGYRKQFWGAESYSPGGSEYFSAGLSLGSSMSSPAYTSTAMQDEVGMQGKEQAGAQAHLLQPASTSAHC